jgi:hypothetical protein
MLQVKSKARATAGWSTAHPLILAAAVLTVAIPASAAAPTVQTGSTDQKIHLDGALDEPAWQQAGVIPNLTQQDPHPGKPTPFTTEVRVLVDATAIYIGIVCHDPDPSRIAIHTMQRDGNMRGDDTVTLGVIATDGDPEGERDNSLGGLDVLWRTSTFGHNRDKNFSIGGWAAWSRGDVPEGKPSGWGFKIDYPNDLWDLYAIVKDFGAGLDPALGFLPRPGTRWYQTGVEYRPRPQGGFFAWVRQFFFEFRPALVENADGQTESWRVFTAPFNAQTQSGEHLEANFMPQFERLDEEFEIADGVVIPPGEYNFTRFRVEAQSSRHRPWRVGATVWFGDFYTGSLTQTEGFVTYTTPSGHLQLELSAENDAGRLPEGDFNLNLGQLKAVYAFTPDLILSSYVQYDSESGDFGANTRFRWTIKPGNDFFVVWFHSWRHPINSDKSFTLRPINDQLVVKLRWTFRR